MERILMLCDWLPPEFGAVGQYAVGFADELAAAGHAVTLVGFSSTAESETSSDRGAGRLRVRRIRMAPERGGDAFARLRWMLRANLALVWNSRRELAGADEVRFTGSPAYLLFFVVPLAKILGVRTRYRITDFHPEWLIATLGRAPPWLRLVRAVARFWRRRVDFVEVLGEDQRLRIAESGVDPDRVVVRPDATPVPVTADAVAAPLPEALAGRKIVLYSGHWGAPHDHRTFLEGYARLCRTQDSATGVWLNAVGPGADEVERGLRARGLACARTPLVPLDRLASVLVAADVHLITLHDAFVGYALPSKVHGCVASGRSVLFIGSATSDVHRICARSLPSSRYRRVDVGDAAGAAVALAELLDLRVPADDAGAGAGGDPR